MHIQQQGELSLEESNVLVYVAMGLEAKQIAEQVTGLTPNDGKKFAAATERMIRRRESIRGKLDARNIVHIPTRAVQEHIFEVDDEDIEPGLAIKPQEWRILGLLALGNMREQVVSMLRQSPAMAIPPRAQDVNLLMRELRARWTGGEGNANAVSLTTLAFMGKVLTPNIKPEMFLSSQIRPRSNP